MVSPVVLLADLSIGPASCVPGWDGKVFRRADELLACARTLLPELWQFNRCERDGIGSEAVAFNIMDEIQPLMRVYAQSVRHRIHDVVDRKLVPLCCHRLGILGRVRFFP